MPSDVNRAPKSPQRPTLTISRGARVEIYTQRSQAGQAIRHDADLDPAALFVQDRLGLEAASGELMTIGINGEADRRAGRCRYCHDKAAALRDMYTICATRVAFLTSRPQIRNMVYIIGL